MKDNPTPRAGTHSGSSDALTPRINRDLNALATESRRNQPTLDQTIRTLSGRRPEKPEERFMAWTRILKARPRLMALGATALLALALLVVPISYDKVVGHEVTLELDGNVLNQDLLTGIAQEFKEALGTEALEATQSADGGDVRYELLARVPGRDAPAIAEAFAHTLNQRGITASASSSPIKERVSGNVYAMAFDNVIRISIDDKSPEELEAEIAAQFEAAGIDAQVSVTMEGDDHMKVEITAEAEGPVDEGSTPQIVLTSGGEPLGGGPGAIGEIEDVSVRIVIEESATGQQSQIDLHPRKAMIVEVEENGETVRAKVEDYESLSDAELADRVQRLLASQGVNVSVSSQNGRLRVWKLDPAGDDAGTRETTWGSLKSKDWNDN